MQKLRIRIHLNTQQLDLLDGDTVARSYPVSTAKNGAGEQDGSECTPRGTHQIAQKIGCELAIAPIHYVLHQPTAGADCACDRS